uniref:F-box domain-containing protein n=1 Tax=Aegilops tauschii subsp. strangulata TaxID=200361 RepID=A0A453LYX1_AEGTS
MVGGRWTDAFAKPKHPRPAGGDDGSNGGDAGGGGGIGHAGDRLSALPDDLLHAIMSRLKALQMVRTCMLSTRWRHLWRAVPCLDVDEEETGAYNNFDNFTSNLLHCHDIAVLEDFRLHAARTSDRWVRRAVGQGEAWPCRLKSLHLFSLSNLNLTDIGSHISSRCFALEDVQLRNCSFVLTSNAKIVSASLKKLAVVDGYYMVHDDEIFALIIEAPALVSLCLDGELEHIVDMTEPHTVLSLVDASIQLPRVERRVNHQLGILGALSNVTTLRLSHFAVMLLFYATREDLPVFKFENLRSLLLDECHISDDFLGLQQYLHNSRNLKKLTLRCCKVLDYRHNKEMRERLHKSSEDLVDFNCENLRLSEIIYRDGDTSVHLLVMFLVGMPTNLPNNKIEFTKID